MERITLTFAFEADELRAIAAFYGEQRLATREECEAWITSAVRGALEDAQFDLDHP